MKLSKEPEPRSGVKRAHGQSPRALQKEPTSGFLAGVELIRAGEYFAAHEELEDAWRAAPAEERDFFQGLVHVAVAWYQAGRGRKIGTERQLAKAVRRPHRHGRTPARPRGRLRPGAREERAPGARSSGR